MRPCDCLYIRKNLHVDIGYPLCNYQHHEMNKQIIRLAVPNIISNLSVPILGAVDIALMGRLESERHLGAVAIGAAIFNMLYWGFGFLRMSTTGLTAQAHGANNHRESILILTRGLLVAVAVSVSLILTQSLIANISFYLIDASTEVEQLARQYFLIRIYAAPAALSIFVFHGWFLGVQNARYPMILTVLMNLLNIGLNLFFVKAMGLKSNGVALGTVIAQYLGLVCAAVLFVRKHGDLLDGWHVKEALHLPDLKRFFAISGDIFIRTLCLVFSHTFFTAKSAAVSDTILAVNTILLQYIYFLAYAIDGFAFAAESIIGKYKGAVDIRNLRLAVRHVFIWGIGLAGVFTLIFGLLGQPLLYVFTNKFDIVKRAFPYLIWVALTPIINAVAYLWDGIFIGATASKPLRNAMIASTFVVFLPAYFLLKPLGNHGLWLALTLYSVARGLTLTALAPKYILKDSPAESS